MQEELYTLLDVANKMKQLDMNEQSNAYQNIVKNIQ